MTRKPILKPLIITAIVLLVAGAILIGLLTLNQSASQNQTNTNSDQANTPAALQPAEIAHDELSYNKPEGWAKLSAERLEATASVSGVAVPSADVTRLPVATVTMQINKATPQNNDDLKNSTINELDGLSNFELLAYEDTTVDGKPGKKFIYKFGDQEKTKQEMTAVVHNNKTFFILYSTTEAGFDQYKPDADSILASFKFK